MPAYARGMTTVWGKGQHPDLDESNNVRWDVALQGGATPAERDLNRDFEDDARRDHFLSQLAAEQSELPIPVQQYVQGRAYAGSASQGYQSYLQDRTWAMGEWARRQGYERVVTDTDVSRMSLEQYDHYFDSRGVPRDGVLHWRQASRSSIPTDGTDRYSQAEARQMGRRR